MSLATSNLFSALSTKTSKKKPSEKPGKDGDGEPVGKKASKKAARQREEEHTAAMEAAIFGGAQPSVSNWADELDEEEDFELSTGGGLAPLPDDWAAEVSAAMMHAPRSVCRPVQHGISSLGYCARSCRWHHRAGDMHVRVNSHRPSVSDTILFHATQSTVASYAWLTETLLLRICTGSRRRLRW